MPSSSNSLGNLEISDLSLPVLNDRLRRIGLALNGSAGTGTNGATGATGAAGASGTSQLSQVSLTVPGILAIEMDVCPILTLPSGFQPTTINAYVKRAPIGSPIAIQVYVNGTSWGSAVTIAAGTNSATSSAVGPVIAVNQIIRLDITSVGALLTGVSFPGSDLTVILR